MCVHSERILKLATNISRDKLVSVGTCFGKFTKTNKFRLHITALDFLAPYAKVIMTASQFLSWLTDSINNLTYCESKLPDCIEVMRATCMFITYCHLVWNVSDSITAHAGNLMGALWPGGSIQSFRLHNISSGNLKGPLHKPSVQLFQHVELYLSWLNGVR